MGGWGPAGAPGPGGEVPCRYYAKGACNRGTQCPFVHTGQPAAKAATYAREHDRAHSNNSPQQQQQQQQEQNADGKASERSMKMADVKVAEVVFGPADEDEAVRNLMINYIPNEISEHDLAMIFSVYGPVRQVRVIHDPKTKQSKGYGFVRYMYGFSAYAAMAFLNGYRVYHKALKVSYADQDGASRLINEPSVTARWREQQPRFVEHHLHMQQGEYAYFFARKCMDQMYQSQPGRLQ
eukprot:TRINITY_DN1427_c3_g1_i1.p1 TRINITY_DN1427_c3_g1~~TRINITY_DN1427_c3_g1_i1.p1  ORF type:complete len:238 (+),score=69.89 TRINITY_DN1427_c3_g1_i1:44-757(+)